MLGWLLFCVMLALAIDRQGGEARMAVLDATPACVPKAPPPRIYHPWQKVPKDVPDHRRTA